MGSPIFYTVSITPVIIQCWPGQTVQTQVRQLPEEQCDQTIFSLLFDVHLSMALFHRSS